jgi:hypothetical protein
MDMGVRGRREDRREGRRTARAESIGSCLEVVVIRTSREGVITRSEG